MSDRVQRERFICDNLGLVHACARRFTGRGLEYDDLYQAGCMGLVKAVDGFEPQRGLQFSTYAVPVILGEMRRLFRDGGAVKVSRSLKELSLRACRERDRFMTVHGREPTVGEMAALLGVEREQAAEALAAALPPVSLTRTEEDDGADQIDVPVAPDDERLVDVLALRQVMQALPTEDRTLLVLRYLRRQTQQVTAQQLGLTQVQVSRRERALLARLREQLTG